MRVKLTLRIDADQKEGVDYHYYQDGEVLKDNREQYLVKKRKVLAEVDIDPALLSESRITFEGRAYIIWAKIPRLLENERDDFYNKLFNNSYMEIVLDPL